VRGLFERHCGVAGHQLHAGRAQAQLALLAELHAGEQILEALGGHGGVDDAGKAAIGLVDAPGEHDDPIRAHAAHDRLRDDQVPVVRPRLAEVLAVANVQRPRRLAAIAGAHVAVFVGHPQGFEVRQQAAAALQQLAQLGRVAARGLAVEAEDGGTQQQVDLVDLAFERLAQRLRDVGGRGVGAVKLRLAAVDERGGRQRGDQHHGENVGTNEAAHQPHGGREARA
jgi:hypothetical protein